MLELNRLRVGEFDIENSVTIEELESYFEDKEWINNNVITLEKIMENYSKIEIPGNKIDLFLNGVKIAVGDIKDGIYRAYCNGNFLGSAEVFEGRAKRDIILNND